jgi:phenylacetate-CoA ligase
MYRAINLFVGQVRGYDRRRIRREALRNALLSAAELRRQAYGLFQSRVRDAIRRYPLYEEKVAGCVGIRPREAVHFPPQELPIWTRDDQRRLFESLGGKPVENCFAHCTGGSTGVPLRFYVTRESFEWRMAVSDRGYSWAGAEEGRRSFYVWGTPIRDPGRLRKLKEGLHHWLQRRTYFDSFHFGDDDKEACCLAINRAKPRAIVGYAGNLVELGRFAIEHPGLLKWQAESAVTAAEGLLPGQRDLLQQSLAREVFQSYGSREFMLIGMECSRHVGYHISSDNLLVEVVDEKGQPAPPGTTGRILVTDLHNAANPFIRYEINDLGALSGEPCDCGLPFPMLARVDGRIQEAISLPDGRRLTALFIPHLMKEFPWIQGYQLVQEKADRLAIHLIAREALTHEMTRPLEIELRKKVGPAIEIAFQKVVRLQKNASGKTPIVVKRWS